MQVIENILWLVVLIGVMIIVHELGHFWAARWFDVKVEVFSIGFGPRLFGWRRGETDFRVAAIPFGGYVKMEGEQPGDEHASDPRSFQAKPRWQRLIIAFAGPAMNVLLAVAILTGLFMVRFPKPVESAPPGTIGYVVAGSPAAQAGIKEGDRIVRINSQQNPTWDDILLKEVASAGKPLSVTIERDGRRFDVTLTPVLDPRLGVGSAGWTEHSQIQVGSVSPGLPAEKAGLRRGDILLSINGSRILSDVRIHEIVRSSEGKPLEVRFLRDGQPHVVMIQPQWVETEGPPRWMIGIAPERRFTESRLSFPEALLESTRQNLRSATLIYQFLLGIIERRMSAKSLEGPIRIAQLSGDAARQGAASFIALMAMVSLNLAIFNLLPIPILDGGMILVLLIEMLIRRDLSLQIKETILKLGFVFLMVVVAFVIYNDITKILPRG